jgi:cell division protein FtsZ
MPEIRKPAEKPTEKKEDLMAPTLVDDIVAEDTLSFIDSSDDVLRMMEDHELPVAEKNEIIHWELKTEEPVIQKKVDSRMSTVDKKSAIKAKEELNSNIHITSPKENSQEQNKNKVNSTAATASAVSGGYLARPSNIYAAEPKAEISNLKPSAEEPVSPTVAKQKVEDIPDMQLVERNDIPAADLPLAHQAHRPLTESVEAPAERDETVT